MLERAARAWVAAPPWVENLPIGSHPAEGRAWRGAPVARPWGVGSGEQILAREHRRSAPRAFTEQNDLTKGCLWGGSAPPNGSRLSCGRHARRRASSGRQSVAARAQHSDSLKAITARQLQALVRWPRSVASRRANTVRQVEARESVRADRRVPLVGISYYTLRRPRRPAGHQAARQPPAFGAALPDESRYQ